jgi:N-acetylmuramoyl-L-alanine amidase
MDTDPVLRSLLKVRPAAISTSVMCMLCVLMAVCCAPSLEASAAIKPAIKHESAPKQSPEQQYSDLKDQLAKLTGDTQLGNRRDRWEALAQSFHHMHLAHKKEGLGVNSLFMSAQVHRMMHQRFGRDEDGQVARERYLQLADLYPGNTLADDALFEAAGIAGSDATAPEALYQQILAQYPQGDQAVNAKKKLSIQSAPPKETPLATDKPAPTPPKAGPPSSVTPPEPQSQPLTNASADYAKISPAKFWSSQHYSRIVFASEAPVPYTVKKLSDQPAQLELELLKSTLENKNSHPQVVDQGLLKQILPTQPQQGLVRYLVDLKPFVEYKVFTLQNPFRVVVDIYGYPTGKASPTEGTEQPSPAATVTTTTSPNIPVNTPKDIVVLSDQKKSPVSNNPIPSPSKSKHEQLSLAQQLGLGVKTIVIDPGHGGKDPGAMAFGLKEKDIVLRVAQKLANHLKQTTSYQVVLTRTKDVFIPLEKRTAMANAYKADLFISIHVNAHADQTSSGIETYFLNLATDADAMRVAALENASSNHSIGELQDILSSLMNNSKIDESSRLARFVQSNLINGLKSTYKPRDLGVKQAPFYVLIGAEMPAILAELSFITNPAECKLLQDDTHLEKLAKQLAGGIVAYIDHHHAAAKVQ